jgi:hypothetical protein
MRYDRRSATPPPRTGSKQDATMIPNRPPPTNIDAELATPPATKKRVASTPTRGQKGSTF